MGEWEEVDSLGKSHVAAWPSRDDLLDTLSNRDETVLVLYPAHRPKDTTEDEDDDEEPLAGPKLRRVSKKAELKAVRKREKEERKLARGSCKPGDEIAEPK